MTQSDFHNLSLEASRLAISALTALEPYAVYITFGFLLVACPTFLFLIFRSAVVPVEALEVDCLSANDPMSVSLKDVSTQLYRYKNETKRGLLQLSERLARMEAKIEEIEAYQATRSKSKSKKPTVSIDTPKIELALAQLRSEMGSYTCLLREEIADTLNRNSSFPQP